MSNLINYTLHLADNALILGQRNTEWCGHGPILEQDIAITNISLDLVGQARSFYQYAAQLKADDSTEDMLAYFRTERDFKNCLLVEQQIGPRQYSASFYSAVTSISYTRSCKRIQTKHLLLLRKNH